MNTCTYLVHTLSLIYIMKLIVIFGIKIYRKLPRCLTLYALLMTLFVDAIIDSTNHWSKGKQIVLMGLFLLDKLARHTDTGNFALYMHFNLWGALSHIM
jgi:hypothetical protein